MVEVMKVNFPICGFILLPADSIRGYRGVDRNPFVPGLTKEVTEIESPVEKVGSFVWPFYPPGWRRDAYRLYEENLVPEIEENLPILSSLAAAQNIKRIIDPHLGSHDVVRCELQELQRNVEFDISRQIHFWGYDVAYFGGDFFSAVRAGLFGSPWFDEKPFPELVAEFGPFLNEFGLFSAVDPIDRYISSFKRHVPSEGGAKWKIWGLSFVE